MWTWQIRCVSFTYPTRGIIEDSSHQTCITKITSSWNSNISSYLKINRLKLSSSRLSKHTREVVAVVAKTIFSGYLSQIIQHRIRAKGVPVFPTDSFMTNYFHSLHIMGSLNRRNNCIPFLLNLAVVQELRATVSLIVLVSIQAIQQTLSLARIIQAVGPINLQKMV